MAGKLRCWCGETHLDVFGGGYVSCSACESLVRMEPPSGDVEHVRDEERDLYGREYWFSHQRELGHPSIETRSVEDLGERCLAWLYTVLAFRPIGGRAVELGAAHGGFVAMLRWAGFDASGIELSPWICRFANQTFDVPMHTGPIEEVDIEPGLDLVVAMDVLEHLPEPMATLERAADLLSDDGLLIFQTPCRPVGKGYEDLCAEEHRFLEMLIPEHLFLLSARAAELLCHRAGLGEVCFEPALFPHYDMCVLASRRPLVRRRRESVRTDLAARPTGRLLAGMLALYQRHADGERSSQEVEALRIDQRDKETLIKRLAKEIETLRGDQASKEALLREISAELAEVRRDQASKEKLLREISTDLAEVREDQVAKEKLLREMAAELAETRRPQAGMDEAGRETLAELAEVREDQAAKRRLIEQMARPAKPRP